jgi:hypothetical protein
MMEKGDRLGLDNQSNATTRATASSPYKVYREVRLGSKSDGPDEGPTEFLYLEVRMGPPPFGLHTDKRWI